MKGIAVILPSLENGDWEVMLTLEDKCMAAFKENILWQQYAQM